MGKTSLQLKYKSGGKPEMPMNEIYFDISTTLDPIGKSKNVTHFGGS